MHYPLSRTTRVSQYRKGKTNLDITEATDSEWQWYQLGHMQICTLPETDNYASTLPLNFYRPDALPADQQQHQSTEGNESKSVSKNNSSAIFIITPHQNDNIRSVVNGHF